MDRQRNNVPLALLAVVLVLLLFYVGSYSALVQPRGVVVQRPWQEENGEVVLGNWYYHYQYGEHWAERFYWPLEQIDRQVRPEKWR
jgi:hypothetical protein